MNRGNIFQLVLEEERAELGNCNQCLVEPAIVKCISCTDGKTKYCADCDETRHRLLPLHDRAVSFNGCLQSVSSYVTVRNGAFVEICEFIYFICRYIINM